MEKKYENPWHILHGLLGSRNFRLVWNDIKDKQTLEGINRDLKDAIIGIFDAIKYLKKFNIQCGTKSEVYQRALKKLKYEASNENQRRYMRRRRDEQG